MAKSVALSQGVATDNTTIQLVETIAVVGIGLAFTGLFGWIASVVTIVAGVALLASTLEARRRRCVRNEVAFETTRYAIPRSRENTIQRELPEDVRDTLATLYDVPMTRPALASQLRTTLGEARSAAFLPVVLLYADQV